MQIRLLGGAEAEAAARTQYAQPWEAVAREELEERVRATATRAFWDALGAQVAAGSHGALFGVLGELQQSMRALLASPRAAAAREELDDRFDAGWLESQAAHGALTTAQVQALIEYVTRQIASWQAPVDDAATAAWQGAVTEMLSRTRDMELTPFIADYLVPFLRGAIDRVGQVYSRLMAMAPREAQAEAAGAAADAMLEQD